MGFTQQHNHTLSEKQIDSALVANQINISHSELFSKLIIQDAGGRMKPIHTYASELLRKVSKHDTYKDMNATQVFLSIQQNPRLWFQIPIIYVEKGNTKLRDIVGIPHDQKYATLADFFDEKGMYKISEYQQEAQKTNIKSKFEKDGVKNASNDSFIQVCICSCIFLRSLLACICSIAGINQACLKETAKFISSLE